jgi:putative transcriptional regulator
MTITHHLDDATLVSFAAGTLPDALAAVTAGHIAMCPRCRRELAMLEDVGAILMSELRPAALELPLPAMPQETPVQAVSPSMRPGEIPEPLASLIGQGLDDIRWRWIGPGLWHRPLQIRGKGALQLLKAAPGASVPEHTHGGDEMTLVLRGALADETGRYGPGDVADLDEEIEHLPVADEKNGCVCVIANEYPTRFRGLLARLMQPWHGF